MKRSDLETGLLVAIVAALTGWVWSTNVRLALIEEENKIHEEQDETHDELSARIRKFWKLHHRAEDEINWLRRLHDLEPERWFD